MSLNLTKFIPPDESIEWNNETLILTANIPRAITKKYIARRAEIMREEISEKHLDFAEDYVKDLLYVKNEKEKVDRIVKEWSDLQINQVFMFYNSWIKEISYNSDIGKKKANSENTSISQDTIREFLASKT